MSLSLENLKEVRLSSTEQYDIINFAIQSANEYGFLNQFVFSRGLYVFLALTLYKENKDEAYREVKEAVSEKGVLTAFDKMLSNGLLDDMVEKYSNEILFIASDNASLWFEDYQAFLNSPRQGFESLNALNEKTMENFSQKMNDSIAESNIPEVLEIADKWGMNNALATA